MRPLLLLLCAVLLSADEVQLITGEVLEGDIVAESTDSIQLRITMGSGTAERAVPRRDIQGITRGETQRSRALAQLRAEVAKLPTTASASEWMVFAKRARDVGEPIEARRWAYRAVAIDPTLDVAQRMLGRELLNGIWMTPNEAAAARGLVWYNDTWVSWDQREQLRHEANERLERQRVAAERAARRRAEAAALAQNDAWTMPASYQFRADTPLKVVWWGGGWPNQHALPFQQFPQSSIRLDGGWGGLKWNMHFNW
ncbi:MAG: hypothetical protein AAB263_08595 [Planctomycetota bacterium]|mgnify:CR=1 FL=1